METYGTSSKNKGRGESDHDRDRTGGQLSMRMQRVMISFRRVETNRQQLNRAEMAHQRLLEGLGNAERDLYARLTQRQIDAGAHLASKGR